MDIKGTDKKHVKNPLRVTVVKPNQKRSGQVNLKTVIRGHFTDEAKIKASLKKFEKSEPSHICQLKIEINGDVVTSPPIVNANCKFTNEVQIDEKEKKNRRNICTHGKNEVLIRLSKSVTVRNVNAVFTKVVNPNCLSL